MRLNIIYPFLLLFLFGSQEVFAQTKLEEFKPIIENYLNEDLDSAEKYSELLLQSAFESRDKQKEHHGLNYLAHIAYRRGNRMNALEFFMESLQIRDKEGTVTETANTLNWIGRIHHEQTDYDKAVEYYFLSLNKLKENPDSSYILSTLNNITRLHLDIGDDVNMLEYNNQSLIISQLTGADLEYANACNLRGMYFQNHRELDSAEHYYQKALSYYSKDDLPHKIAHQYNNLGIIYFFKGDMKKSYSNLLFAKDIRKQLTDTASYAESLRNLGDYYFYTENYDSSLYYYSNSLRLASSIDSKTDMVEIYESLSELHYALKDFEKAYNYHVQYSELQEDIFSIDQFDKLKEMEAKYRFQNQNEQLEIIVDNNKKLLESNNALEQEKTDSEFWIYSLTALCSLLLVVCFLFWKFKN